MKELILCDYDKTIRPVLQEEPLIISTQLLVHSFDFVSTQRLNFNMIQIFIIFISLKGGIKLQ